MGDLEKLVNLLKKVRDKNMNYEVEIRDINSNIDLINEGISFDDEKTCFYGYDNIEDILTSLQVSTNLYGIFIKEKFIGMIGVYFHYYKDLTRLETLMCIKKEYRKRGIGTYCLNNIINYYFSGEGYKSIHISIRKDNTSSIRAAKKLGFKEYTGYKKDMIFTDKEGNKIPQAQYLLTKKEYEKRR